MLMFGLAMSILSRSTCAPSGNSPAFIRRNRSRFSATLRLRYGLGLPGLGQRAAQRAHLVGRRALHVGEVVLDEPLGERVELVVVVGRVVAVGAPVEAEPAHRVGDRRLEFDVLLRRIGVVEAEVAAAAVLGGEAEIQDDRLRVTVMQVAVGLGRKPRDDLAAVFAGAIVLGDDGAQEIGRRRARRGRRRARRRRGADPRRPPGGSTVLAAVQHSSRFVHEQSEWFGYSNRRGRTRHRAYSQCGSGRCPGNPRQIRLSARLRSAPDAGLSTNPVDKSVRIL